MSRPDREHVEERIRAFLAENTPDRADLVATLDLDAEIWQVFGSLDMLELVEYLEKEFALTVHPLEFVPENFSSLRRIVDFADRRLSVKE